MDEKIQKLITDKYGFNIRQITDAPRQFVAETYIIETVDNTKYFCKIITKPLFIQPVIQSLPVLRQLHQSGLDRINYPLPTTSDELYVYSNETLVVIFNYIDALQSYEYNFYAFGALIAQMHNIKLNENVVVPKENFKYQYQGKFENELSQILSYVGDDEINKALKTVIEKYVLEIRDDYTKFLKLSDEIKLQNWNFVITHGDPGGNVLVKSPTDLYLIDWDNILLSCPERDTWFFQNEPEFIKGYQSIFPNYKVNQKLSHYFTYKRYFEDLIEYFAEITGDHSLEHRKKNLDGLKNDCFEGWLRPAIRKFD